MFRLTPTIYISISEQNLHDKRISNKSGDKIRNLGIYRIRNVLKIRINYTYIENKKYILEMFVIHFDDPPAY